MQPTPNQADVHANLEERLVTAKRTYTEAAGAYEDASSEVRRARVTHGADSLEHAMAKSVFEDSERQKALAAIDVRTIAAKLRYARQRFHPINSAQLEMEAVV
jgi:hypothetical protein